jgi:hypothetical protein
MFATGSSSPQRSVQITDGLFLTAEERLKFFEKYPRHLCIRAPAGWRIANRGSGDNGTSRLHLGRGLEGSLRGSRLMTPEQEKEFHHWYNEPHLADLLSTPGVISATRYRNRDGSGFIAVYEFESEDAMEKYITSERRQFLIKDTESRYGDNFFDRKTRFFTPIISKRRE